MLATLILASASLTHPPSLPAAAWTHHSPSLWALCAFRPLLRLLGCYLCSFWLFWLGWPASWAVFLSPFPLPEGVLCDLLGSSSIPPLTPCRDDTDPGLSSVPGYTQRLLPLCSVPLVTALNTATPTSPSITILKCTGHRLYTLGTLLPL